MWVKYDKHAHTLQSTLKNVDATTSTHIKVLDFLPSGIKKKTLSQADLIN